MDSRLANHGARDSIMLMLADRASRLQFAAIRKSRNRR